MSNAATAPQSPREETLSGSVTPQIGVHTTPKPGTVREKLRNLPRRPKIGEQKRKQLNQIDTLQSIAFTDCQDPETTPAQRAALMRAYCDLSDRRRVILGQPLPGQLRPEKSTGKKSIID